MSVRTHLVQLMPDRGALLQWAASRGFLPGQDLGYGLHAAISAVWGDKAPRSFVYLDSFRGHDRPHLLAYSAMSAEDLMDHAGLFGEPLAMKALGVQAATSKALPRVAAGTLLGMEILTRPVVREERGEGPDRKTTEHDPYLLAKLKAGGSDAEISRERVYLDWLEGRLAERGLDVEAMGVVARREVSVARRDRSRGDNTSRLRQVPGQEVRYLGLVRVVDEAAFAEGLPRGIGRHRAFGYGMMILRSPHEIGVPKAA